MRPIRFGVCGVLSALLLVLGTTSVPAAPRSHGPNLWAGQWTTSTGGVAFRLLDEVDDIAIAKAERRHALLYDKLPCKGGPQFYRGGYTGSNSGKVIACGTPTSLKGRWSSNEVDTDNGSFTITITSRSPLKFSGTATPDSGAPFKWTGTWNSHFGGDGAESDLKPVPIKSVSNGCGGAGWGTQAQNYLGNTSVYRNSNVNPAAQPFTVNFVDACDLHDAGYSGAIVRDKLRGGIKDFRRWSRKQVDDKFLADMRLLCRQTIPGTAGVALTNCLNTGGNFSIGSVSRYNFVRRFGDRFFDADLTKAGTQRTGPRANN